MKRKPFKILILTIVACTSFTLSLTAQAPMITQGLSLKLSPGALAFFGDMGQNDLNPILKIGQGSKFGVGISFIKQFSPVIGIQAQYVAGSLYSKYTVAANPLASTYFAGSISEFGLSLRVDPIHLLKNKEFKFSPYLSIGIASVGYRSARKFWSTNQVILPTFGYKTDGVTAAPRQTAMAVPIALGLSYQVLPSLALELEHSLRFTNTDLLDCLKGATAVNDYYSLTSLGIRYTIGTKSGGKIPAPAAKGKAPAQKEPQTKPARSNTRTAQKVVEPIKEPAKQPVLVINDNIQRTDVFIDCDIPETVQTGRLFETKIRINKADYKGPGKLIQRFPEGFSALELQSSNCTFSFIDQTVIIEWDQMPADSVISYSYHVKTGESLSGIQTIIGRFEYQQPEGQKTTKFNKNVFVDNRVEDLMDRKFKEIVGEGDGLNANKLEVKNENSTEQHIEQLMNQYGGKPITTSAKGTTGKVNIRQAQPVSGVEFRIQCGAFRDGSQAASLAAKYRITDELQEESQDGWFKYTVGNFRTYDEAVRFRDSFIQRTKILSAFIVAYRDGKRLARTTDAYR